LGDAGALQGDPNTAVAFTGSNSVSLPVTPVSLFKFASNETKTVELWVKTTDSSGPIFSARSSTGNGVFGFYVGSDGVTGAVGGAGDGKLRLLLRSDDNTGETEIVTPMTINDGNWHHIVATYGGKNIQLYVDGGKIGTTITATSWTGSLTPTKVALGTDRYWVDSNVGGVSEDQRYLTGSVDEVAVYYSGLNLLPIFAGHALLGLDIPTGGAVSAGLGSSGQLGNGTTSIGYRPSYGRVQGLVGVTDLASGNVTSCAVASGAAKCWGAAGATGDGSNGLIGNGTSQGASTPQQVVGLTSNVTAVAVGQYVACAIRSGAVLCWGDTFRTGTGSSAGGFLMAPVASTITSGATHIAAGPTGTCAIVGDQVLCWGPNGKGQMGNNSTATVTTPTAVQGLPAGTPTAISVGYQYACAVVNAAAYCWGDQANGRLGNNTTAAGSVLTAQPVPAMSSGVTSIAGQNGTTCAVQTGEVWCWGLNNVYQLGRGAAAGNADSGVPQKPVGLPSSGARAVNLWNQALVGYEDGQVFGWGYNIDGRLGNGGVQVESNASPIRIDTIAPSLAGAQKVSTGGGHTIWLK
jgi:alpha-tubulin suppressor-like RCC1 family protein